MPAGRSGTLPSAWAHPQLIAARLHAGAVNLMRLAAGFEAAHYPRRWLSRLAPPGGRCLMSRVGVRTRCVEREERIEQHWETAKWLGLPGRNVLIEVCRSSADPAEHKKTAHCQTWRDTVAEMMTEPRSSVKYNNIFPDDAGWG